jgi:FkbM family methyltransferase
METKKNYFDYDGNTFIYTINEDDLSGLGCIREIITENEYKLNKFKGLKNKVLFDIGANCGIATIVMAKLNPESVIYSFEPHKQTYNLLCENVRLNNLTNVKTYNVAVMSENKEVEMMLNNIMSGANTLVSNENNFKNVYYNTSVTNVTAISFDNFIKDNNIDNVYLLKIDCEGGEYDILYNSEYVKNKLVSNIVGEFHDFKKYIGDGKNNGKALIDYCIKYINGFVKLSVLDLTSQY